MDNSVLMRWRSMDSSLWRRWRITPRKIAAFNLALTSAPRGGMPMSQARMSNCFALVRSSGTPVQSVAVEAQWI